jgi:hypothetical protein
MINAKEELQKHIGDRKMIAVTISLWKDFDEPMDCYHLAVNHTKEMYHEFLSKIDKDYDNGYGSQELFGLIWYADGTWSERTEYNGAEKWAYKSCPRITDNLTMYNH